jgi:hypothetical protein
VGPEN